MALCLKCLIGTGGQGGGLMPPDIARFRLEVGFTPDSEEAAGERNAVFEGEVVAGDPLDGGVSVTGLLAGNFGLSEDEPLEMTAFVETYTRNGSIALITLNVHEGGERFVVVVVIEMQIGMHIVSRTVHVCAGGLAGTRIDIHPAAAKAFL